MQQRILTVPIHRFEGDASASAQDLVAAEDPLQISVNGHNLAITMRTPGHDRELAAGFLFTEGIVRDRAEIASMTTDGKGGIDVTLSGGAEIDPERFARNFYLTSSCGVCGKASIEALQSIGCPYLSRDGFCVSPSLIATLPDKLRASQKVFEHTGGLHGSALFDAKSGAMLAAREDVGRHNALDKLIGAAFLEGHTPLDHAILLLSGRISFELVQKALMAGIPVVAAVGAPSSLAIETARRFNMTLIGFLRGLRFNLYAGEWRVSTADNRSLR
jgi:FdhD protein